MSVKAKMKWWLLKCVPCVFVLFLSVNMKLHAAFPPDIARKPVIVRPLHEAPSEADYYTEAALSHRKGSVAKSELVLSATKVRNGAIYGSFEKGAETHTGWFALKEFISDPGYENEYATVRAGMNVYTDEALDEILDKIKKYSGVIIVSAEGDSRQVIYQKKKGYGVGWMSEEELTNTLVYDGRDKQTLADGTYLFRSGYQDNASGGEAIKKQPELTKYSPYTWDIIYASDNNYYIRDPGTERYLAVCTHDGGLSFSLCQTKEPDERYGLFHLERAVGSYTIQNVKSDLYLAQNKEKELTLNRYRCGSALCWRLSALETMVDKKLPMVFTQYDPQWCGVSYGSEGSMGTAGCGILATVNAVYALSGQYMDVMELADYAVEKGYRIVGSGTDDGIFKAACKKYGRKYNFTWDGHGGSIEQLKKKLDKGDTAVVHVQGHYVSIVAYDKKKKKFLMLDSNYLPKREDTAFGDWISAKRLMEGALEAQEFYYFKLRDPGLFLTYCM